MTIEDFKSQPNLKPYFDGAYGYAYFPTIGKGGFGIGGAAGSGQVYVNRDRQVGEVQMIQLSFGWQLGGQVYSEIIFFEAQKDFDNFTSGNFEFGADANVVALTASASVKASTIGNQGGQAGWTPQEIEVDNARPELSKAVYSKGMSVFTIVKGGLMYEASVKGQKFNYKPL
mmetsp:Transcript_5069/g.12829  ORF Transcript_5069/g.12829 Transcript_5069/m.12829 type:complete len:172 (-) Transcript_5069:1347-1862(-)